jgi:hypothetical protein
MEVAELLAGTGLDHEAIPGDRFAVPIRGGQRGSTVVEVTALRGNVVRVVAPLADLPTRWGKPRGRAFILERLLTLTRRASYAKAIALGPDSFALAADLPVRALTPRTMRGVILALASLADMKSGQLLDARWWEESRVKALQALADHLRLDEEEARRSAIAVLRAAGLEVEERDDRVMVSIDQPEAFLAVFVEPTVSDVSLMVFPSWQIRAPIRGEAFMVRLMELNREASIAKAGIDGEGDVWLFYQLPEVRPELLADAWEELARLVRAVEDLDQSRSWR